MSPGELLAHHDAEVDRRREELYRAEKDREQAIAKHCAENPLSDETVKRLADHVRDAGELCCTSGRAWLSGRVDSVWTRVINDWAYDALGCSRDLSAEEREAYAQKVLDRRFERKGDDS